MTRYADAIDLILVVALVAANFVLLAAVLGLLSMLRAAQARLEAHERDAERVRRALGSMPRGRIIIKEPS